MKEEIFWWRTSFGQEESEKIRESIMNEHISMGGVSSEFEEKLAKELNCKHVVATTSGSTALLMACMALGIGNGDEVIVPNRTWIATAHSPMILGARVVLVDCKKDIPIIDESKIQEKITPKTKAILPVSLDGRSPDLKTIKKIAEENNLFVIEDACQAMFSKNKNGYLGTQTDIGCFSLGVTKLISTGQGGFLALNNEELYEKIKLMQTHGTNSTITPEYKMIGSNFRFTDIQASIGLVQLKKYKENITHVNEVYNLYKEALESIDHTKIIPVRTPNEVPLYVEVLCEERERLVNFLKSKDVNIRYFLPNINSAPYLKIEETFSNSDFFSKNGLFLPCGPAQPLENVTKVIKALKEFK